MNISLRAGNGTLAYCVPCLSNGEGMATVCHQLQILRCRYFFKLISQSLLVIYLFIFLASRNGTEIVHFLPLVRLWMFVSPQI